MNRDTARRRSPSGAAPRPAILAVVLAIVVSLGAAACAPSPAPAGPRTAGSCPWAQPSRDPAAPAGTCGVVGTELENHIDRHADLLPSIIELYDDRSLTCVPTTACVAGDDRDLLTAHGPAPTTDPSRRRALLTLDWADDRAVLVVNPRCQVTGPPQQPTQQCRSVSAQQVRFALTTVPGAATPWRFRLELAVAGDPGGAPSPPITDRWDLALAPATGRISLDGDGTGTPDFAMISQSTVLCVEPGAAPPHPPAPLQQQHYHCDATLFANP